MWSDNLEHEEAVRAAICTWAHGPARLTILAEYAVQRRGYSTDGTRLTYPGDLDDSARVQGRYIPPGYVEAAVYCGIPEERSWLVPEPFYLAVLAEMLDAAGFAADARRVRAKALVAE
jgi:hypothetical protein